MTTITVHNEPTRRVLQQALWNHASEAVGEERFYNDLYCYAWSFVNRNFAFGDDAIDQAVRQRFELLDGIREAARRLTDTGLGGSVELPVELDALIDGLSRSESWIRGVRQLPGFVAA